MRLHPVLLLAVVSLAACAEPGAIDGSDLEPGAAELSSAKLFDHVAIGRMFTVKDGHAVRTVHDQPFLKSASAADYGHWIGTELARLEPSYVSGLIRIHDPDYVVSQDEKDAFAAARAANPGAKFDVVISTKNGQSAPFGKDAILRLMKHVDDALHPDVWYVDFFDEGGDAAVSAAVKWAHDHGQRIGGNFFGKVEASNMHGTDHADFFAVTDSADLTLRDKDRARIAGLRDLGVPVLVHVNNNPQNGKSNGACTWLDDDSYADRLDYLKKRAAQQGELHFTYMFNAFFPTCPLTKSYDAATDVDPSDASRTMIDEMRKLLGVSDPPMGGGTASGVVAFQANTSDLFTTGDHGTKDWHLGMRAGTSPAVAVGANGAFAVAFQANTGDLWIAADGGSKDTGLGMMAGTSPAIVALRDGGFQVAFQANSGELWTAGPLGTKSLGLGMMAGTSPAIAPVGAGYEIAFQANTTELWTAGTAGTKNTQLGMQPGSSPSILGHDDGSFVVAFQANTGALWTLSSKRGAEDLGFGMMNGTSPSIVALANGGHEIAFQANTGDLWVTGGAGTGDLGLAMMPGTSPAIAAHGASYRVVFQASTTDLVQVDRGKVSDLGLGMMAATSPSGS